MKYCCPWIWHGLMPVLPQCVFLFFNLLMGKLWTQYIDFFNSKKLKPLLTLDLQLVLLACALITNKGTLTKFFYFIYTTMHTLYMNVFWDTVLHIPVRSTRWCICCMQCGSLDFEGRSLEKHTSYLWNVHYYTNLISDWLYFYYSWKAEPHK